MPRPKRALPDDLEDSEFRKPPAEEPEDAATTTESDLEPVEEAVEQDRDRMGEPRSDTRPPRPNWGSLLGFGRGQVVVAVVLFLSALMMVVTLRAQSAQDVYANMRRDELIQLLDNATSETRRLETEVRELQSTRDNLQSGAEGAEAATEEARRRLDQLQILAGTVPAQGSGIRVTINDGQGLVTPELLLNGVEELRDAGAEVLEFNDAVRITAGSWLGMDDQGRLVADGTVIERPIIIDAIGAPATLEAGARFRGGLVSEIEGPRVNGSVDIEQLEMVEIRSVVEPREPEHARPR